MDFNTSVVTYVHVDSIIANRFIAPRIICFIRYHNLLPQTVASKEPYTTFLVFVDLSVSE